MPYGRWDADLKAHVDDASGAVWSPDAQAWTNRSGYVWKGGKVISPENVPPDLQAKLSTAISIAKSLAPTENLPGITTPSLYKGAALHGPGASGPSAGTPGVPGTGPATAKSAATQPAPVMGYGGFMGLPSGPDLPAAPAAGMPQVAGAAPGAAPNFNDLARLLGG